MKMLKEKLVTLVLIFACPALMIAQDNDRDDEKRIRLGVKAGLNFSNVYDEEGEDFVADGKVGFTGGAFVSVPIGKYLGFQPEILLSQKGFIGTGSILGFNYGLTRTSTFIDVPLMVSFRPAPFLSVMAGPQFSYLVNQKDEFTSSLGGFEIEQEFENDDIRKNILCFAAGFDINVSHLVVSVRAGFDFMDNHGDGTSDTPRYKNTWVQSTLGFRF